MQNVSLVVSTTHYCHAPLQLVLLQLPTLATAVTTLATSADIYIP